MAVQQPSRHDLGLHRLAYGCLVAQAAVLGLTVVVYRAHGLSIVFDQQTVIKASLPVIALVIWVSFIITPGHRRGWITAEAALAFFLMNAITWIVAPGQYGALAIGRPFVDETLAHADAAVGIDVSDALAWVQQHRLLTVLRWAYGTLSLQVLLAIPVMRFLRERDAMWEFVFHFHLCLILTLVASAFWPVAGPYQWFDYTTPLDLARVVTQVNGFHDGTLTVVHWAELDGLISYPSFHTAAGLFSTWAARKRWWLLAPMMVVNGLLVLATFLIGIHYVMDTLAGGLVFAGSLLTYQVVGRRSLLRDLQTRTADVHAHASRA
jgi:membrane-associated phospholipid phosphatase